MEDQKEIPQIGGELVKNVLDAIDGKGPPAVSVSTAAEFDVLHNSPRGTTLACRRVFAEGFVKEIDSLSNFSDETLSRARRWARRFRQ